MLKTVMALAELRKAIEGGLSPREKSSLQAHMANHAHISGRTLDYELMKSSDARFWRRLLLDYAKDHGIRIIGG